MCDLCRRRLVWLNVDWQSHSVRSKGGYLPAYFFRTIAVYVSCQTKCLTRRSGLDDRRLRQRKKLLNFSLYLQCGVDIVLALDV